MIKMLILSFVFSTSISFAQSVPGQVLSNFKKQYPGTEVLEWEAINQKYKAAFFTQDNFYAEAVYSADGQWITTSRQIGENELPQKVLMRWKKTYPQVRSVSAIMLVQKPKKKETYHLSFETHESLVNLVFKKSGRLKEKIEEPISIDD